MAWGGVQLSMGFVPTWGYLVFVRVLLGIFEVRILYTPASCQRLICIITGWIFPGHGLYHLDVVRLNHSM